MFTEVPLLDIKLLRLLGISSGIGYQLLESAVASQRLTRQLRLELPDFLDLSAILSPGDLLATLPRHINEMLARVVGFCVPPCRFEIPGFTVMQYWHARYHHDAACRWLRGVCAELFMESGASPYEACVSSYSFNSN